jgi:hypothetical protein
MPSQQADLIPTSRVDYLEQDPEIRGQKYVCMSFVSPEDVIKTKQAFMFERFVGKISEDVNALWQQMYETFKDNTDFVDSLRKIEDKYDFMFDTERITETYRFFESSHGDELEREFLEKNEFQTTIRGIKVRGSYDTLREAEIRAQVIKRIDAVHNVYIAQVGCWCPWSPNPDDITSQEFAESSLNTLMHGYLKNQEQKDEFYQSRKDKLKDAAEATNLIKKSKLAIVEDAIVSSNDPWMDRKLGVVSEGDSVPEGEGDSVPEGEVPEGVPEGVPDVPDTSAEDITSADADKSTTTFTYTLG